ncbi:MAG TPA: hypothetical protein VFX59_21530 [Polyangiales bacterium]|nr:hypothetical protein [Polyangiales bacterium]
MQVDIERYIAASARVDTTDIDWQAAADAGLSEDEQFVLTYFADQENQTIRYLRMLLGMRIALRPDVAAFLSTWSYEEFFHGYELERMMKSCGGAVADDRRDALTEGKRLNEYIEAALIPVLSATFKSQFPAVYMAFGAIQELTTLRGYEHISERTQNPVLKTLCDRIAKQERRHFAWYFNNARVLLAESRVAQRLTRGLLAFNWVPVGAGTHSPQDVHRLFQVLFHPAPHAGEVMREIDEKMASLPGMEGLALMQGYFSKHGLI